MSNKINWYEFIVSEEATDADIALERPRRYKVVMHNDDFTPMEFVVDVLRAVFYLDEQTATNLMLKVHYEGKATCGVFDREEAEQKAEDVTMLARDEEYPLLCVAEPCDDQE